MIYTERCFRRGTNASFTEYKEPSDVSTSQRFLSVMRRLTQKLREAIMN
jgi:hypothetical protein